jgi:hypothetical protein
MVWFEEFVNEYYDDVANKLQRNAEARGLKVNLKFENYDTIKYDEPNDRRLDVYIDFITYRIYKVHLEEEAI